MDVLEAIERRHSYRRPFEICRERIWKAKLETVSAEGRHGFGKVKMLGCWKLICVASVFEGFSLYSAE